MKRKRTLRMLALTAAMMLLCAIPAFAAGTGDVSGAVESTWSAASGQLKTIVNNVVFPAIDMILACLIFTLTAPTYIWGIIGM